MHYKSPDLVKIRPRINHFHHIGVDGRATATFRVDLTIRMISRSMFHLIPRSSEMLLLVNLLDPTVHELCRRTPLSLCKRLPFQFLKPFGSDTSLSWGGITTGSIGTLALLATKVLLVWAQRSRNRRNPRRQVGPLAASIAVVLCFPSHI